MQNYQFKRGSILPLSIKVGRMDDLYPGSDPDGLKIRDELIAWFNQAFDALQLQTLPIVTYDDFDQELEAEIEVMLCSRAAMIEAFDQDEALGAMIIDPPAGDPFGEGESYAHKLRVAVCVEKSEIETRLREEVEKDGSRWKSYLHEYEIAESATAFHEVAHAILFISNCGLLKPSTIDLLNDAGLIEHDLFDVISCYGIRPLTTNGEGLRWADSVEEAQDQMEEWCEEKGRIFAAHAMGHIETSFYDALGVDTRSLAPNESDDTELLI